MGKAGKSDRGLPPTFNLDIPDQAEVGPVQIGDYLDEVDVAPPRPPKKPTQKTDEESNVVKMPQPQSRKIEPPPALSVATTTTPEIKESPRRRRKAKGPARKQINAAPETLRMIEELIDHVQTYSVQKDAKASEVFHALVLALHEATEFLDLGEVPARGRWGSATAKAFPISLKNAFQEAIAVAYKKNRR
jgi:hypothetical protein